MAVAPIERLTNSGVTARASLENRAALMARVFALRLGLGMDCVLKFLR
jgi:hypothetical protein